MIREHLFHKRLPADRMFRWRGGEVSRIEGFSDGVFAVTLALLVVSTSAPSTFQQLWITVRDLPVFLVSFLLLMMAWQYHYQFFRRYGLADLPTVILNAVFLFLVVFFAYPLKFLATFLWRLILGMDTAPLFRTTPELLPIDAWILSEHAQRTAMMSFYGWGTVGVFGLLGLMCLRAWSLREKLELDALEKHLTVTSIAHHCIMVGVALISLVALRVTEQPGIAGVIYFVLGPLHATLGFISGSLAKRLHTDLLAED